VGGSIPPRAAKINNMEELTKPNGLFLVTNPNGTPNGQK